MFEQLSDRFLNTIKKLRGQHRISAENIEATLKDVRMALLEADVNFKVTKQFIDQVRSKALGADVLDGLNPSQQFIQILHDELVQALGKENSELDVRENPSVVYLVGLQGVGKTTTAAKLALFVRQKLKKKPGLVPADLQRPAAIEQLSVLAKTNGLPVFPTTTSMNVKELLEGAQKWAKENFIEVLIIDTAGRIQLDQELMRELQEMKSLLPGHEHILVADAMLGQASVQVAEGFHKNLGLTGLILTKVDGDARGGAALSIHQVLGLPIKFMGVGEKIAALEPFHPDRLAKRLLDMGDVLSLVEKVKGELSEAEALESSKKFMSNSFQLGDFLKQIQQLKKMGGIQSMLSLLPGMGQLKDQMKNLTPPDDEMKKIEAIIQSMTLQERRDPRVLNGSRRERIAKGSGTRVQDVNRLIRQFDEMKKMMGGFLKGAKDKGLQGLKLPGNSPFRR